MGKFVDLTSKQFGYWTVISYAGKYKFGGSLWLCRCKCGKEKKIRSRALNKQHTQSCGCRIKEVGYPTRRTIAFSMRGHQLWNTFWNIKRRCENPHSQYYYCYGGRGIKCSWRSFDDFFEEMADLFYETQARMPGIKLSIERINVNGDYTKENCTWIPLIDQTKNMTTNVKLTMNGLTLNVSDWARQPKQTQERITKKTIRDRLKLGWSVQKALTQPVRLIKRSCHGFIFPVISTTL